MKSFDSSRSVAFKLIFLWAPILLIFGCVFSFIVVMKSQESNWVILSVGLMFGICIALILTFLTYAWLKAEYKIKDSYLYYQLGLNKGKIPISTITSIQYSTFPAMGNRPALGNKGFLIKYDKKRSLYISPINMESFVETLLLSNDNIKVLR